MIDRLFKDQYEAEELVLKPIQAEMVDRLRAEFKRFRKVVLMAGTGLGKTIIATHIVKSAKDRGKRCLFVNDRITLVNQTSGVFDRFGVEHGIIMADHPRYAPDEPVQVASVQTLARRKIGEFDLIIIDECHSLYKGHKALLKKNPDSFVLGLSATPFTKGLGKHFETHIEPYPLRGLIDAGLLCDFEVFGPDIYDLSQVKTVAGEYHQKQLEKAVDQTHLIGRVVETYLKLGKGRKTICFVQSVAHGRHLVREFSRKGIQSVEVNAYQQDDVRRENMASFTHGETEVICSCEILIKGFDLTSVDCVIWATATKSAIKWIQGTGRGLRSHPGKEICRVIDHGGNCARLGRPDDFDFFELDDGKAASAAAKKKDAEKKERLPKKCPSCDFMKPAGVFKCPACGLIPEFAEDAETVDGKIVKYSAAQKKASTPEQKAEVYAGLKSYGQMKGYKSAWADHKFKAKFGHWPKFKGGKHSIEPGEISPELAKFIRHEQIKFAKSKTKAEEALQ